MDNRNKPNKNGAKLRYEKEADNVYSVDLHNGYTISAMAKYIKREEDADKRTYHVSFWLNRYNLQKMSLMCKLCDNTDLEKIVFIETPRNLPIAILNYISDLQNNQIIDKYIERYEFEDDCFSKGFESYERGEGV